MSKQTKEESVPLWRRYRRWRLRYKPMIVEVTVLTLVVGVLSVISLNNADTNWWNENFQYSFVDISVFLVFLAVVVLVHVSKGNKKK